MEIFSHFLAERDSETSLLCLDNKMLVRQQGVLVAALLFVSALTADGTLSPSTIACGQGTFLENDLCVCESKNQEESFLARKLQGGGTTLDDDIVVSLAGVFDTINFDWGEEIFNFTVSLINNKTDGWHDDIDNILVDWEIANADCDAVQAGKAYWDLRTRALEKTGRGLQGVVGCRCSGASMAVAQIAGLEAVPQVSQSATSAKMSVVGKFPYFSRVVAPGDGRGEVGAMVATLRSFGWGRVSILSTDTDYAKDIANEFRRLWLVREEDDEGSLTWEGQIGYENTVVLDENGSVDIASVRQALDSVPTDDPTVNSRIIILLAHDQHAFPILETAGEMNFQSDTVWIGTAGWVGRSPSDGSTDWMPSVPGYIGMIPYDAKTSPEHQDFLSRLQSAQRADGREVWESLPDYAAAYTVDSIVALAKALSSISPDKRNDGKLVTSTLRKLSFNGVSGRVSFTLEGDRRNPLYTIANLQRQEDGELAWKPVGNTGTRIGSTDFGEEGISGVCFAGAGCGLKEPPSDKYPEPGISDTVKVWVVVVMVVFVVLLAILALKYGKTKKEKILLKESIYVMQKKMDAMKNIDDELVDLDAQVEQAKRKKEALILQRSRLQEKPETWSDSDKILVEVAPEDGQYWAVSDRLRATMSDAHISKLWRVQNTSLWTYYSFHKDRLSMIGIDHNEKSVWHGTSSLDPAVIYSDQQDGYMMQYSQKGFWG